MALKPRDLLGRQLAGKYTLESLIGVGGFGAVYRARQAPIDRLVAVKVNLHSHRADLQARFVREARLQAELRHPGCVMLLDCGETEGLFYLVQEFVSGHSLRDALADGPLEPGRAIELIDQVLGALGEAHRHHIVHRDIKPANVMLTRTSDDREEVRVLDFGIAKLLVQDEDDGESLTGTGMSLGTPAYMAPEQIRPGPIGPPTDLYAVGAMLYRLVAGQPVFAGATIDVLTQQLNAPPPPLPSGLRALDGIIARAMAKAPGDRFQSAAEMQAALAAVNRAALHAAVPTGGPAVGPSTTMVTPSLEAAPTLVTPSAPMLTGLPHAAPIAAPIAAPVAAPPPAGRWRVVGALAALLVVGAAVLVWLLVSGDGLPTADDAAVLAGGGSADAAPTPVSALDSALPDRALPDRALPDRAAPDTTPPDAAPAKPDAAIRRRRRVRRPARRGPDAAKLEARFGDQLDACSCADARSTLRRLGPLVGARKASLTERYEAACVLLLPGNCASR